MKNSFNISSIKAVALAKPALLIKENAKAENLAVTDDIPWYKSNYFIFGTMGTVLLIVIIISFKTKK